MYELIFYAPFVLSLVIFIGSYLHDRRKLVNGFLFSIVLFTGVVALTFFGFTYDIQSLIILSVLILGVYLVFAASGWFIVGVASIWNAHILIKREGFQKSNLLTLLFGLSLFGLFLLPLINFDALLVEGANHWVRYFMFIAFYFLFVFITFLLSSFLYHWYRPFLNKDYVVVLGSGLIDGHIVPPLLQSRIRRAIDFYNKQTVQKGKSPILVFSGGQGPDELLSEAEAMQKWAIAHGIPEEHTLIEDQSVNTFQNMKFSKAVIEQHANGKPYKALFATNNYHVFRASVYARRADFNAQGIGGKTALYYWPNAMLREFIAMLVMNKKWHLAFIGITFLFFLLWLLLLSFVPSS